MAEPHEVLAELEPEAQRAALTRCCGSAAWVSGMLARAPFESTEALLQEAERLWLGLSEPDCLEAFSHHPQIGEDLSALRDRFRGALDLSGAEQSAAAGASESVLAELRDLNLRYREMYGFIFIVCATGKSAEEMLSLLRARYGLPRERELANAAGEQAKITALRLRGLGAPRGKSGGST